MGKSAKFYKRPSKKEKEGLSIKKLIEPTAITKKSGRDSKKISVPTSMFPDNKKKATPAPAPVDQDVEMDVEEAPAQNKNKNTEKEPELPDYVDLFSGKKTYKKIPKKRK